MERQICNSIQPIQNHNTKFVIHILVSYSHYQIEIYGYNMYITR